MHATAKDCIKTSKLTKSKPNDETRVQTAQMMFDNKNERKELRKAQMGMCESNAMQSKAMAEMIARQENDKKNEINGLIKRAVVRSKKIINNIGDLIEKNKKIGLKK